MNCIRFANPVNNTTIINPSNSDNIIILYYYSDNIIVTILLTSGSIINKSWQPLQTDFSILNPWLKY